MKIYWDVVSVLNVLNILLVVDEFLTIERVQEHHTRIRLSWWICNEELEDAHQGNAVLELSIDL